MNGRSSVIPSLHLLAALVFVSLGGCDSKQLDVSRTRAPSDAGSSGRAAHTGADLLVEEPPTLRQATNAETPTQLAQAEPTSAELIAARASHFRALTGGPVVVVRAEAQERNRRVAESWVSTWSLKEQIEGEAVPRSFVLAQPAQGEEYPACGMVEAQPGRTDVLFLRAASDGTYRILRDDLGELGFVRGSSGSTPLERGRAPADSPDAANEVLP